MASFNPNVSGADHTATPLTGGVNTPNPAANTDPTTRAGTTALKRQASSADKPNAKHDVKKLSIDNALKTVSGFKDSAIKGVKTIVSTVQNKLLSTSSKELYEKFLHCSIKASLPDASSADKKVFQDLENKVGENKSLKKLLILPKAQKLNRELLRKPTRNFLRMKKRGFTSRSKEL